MLQYYCKKLGITTGCTPVALCKVAGKGIKFDWCCSKVAHYAKHISLKKTKSKFHSLVQSVLSYKVLTISVCQAKTQRTRQHILANMTLEIAELDQSQANQEHNFINHIKKSHKEYK